MPRKPRIVVPGHPHHVTQRGVRALPIFFSDEDRARYLRQLAQEGARCDVTFLAYCLMSNHVHLVAVPQDEDGLTRAIGKAHRDYAIQTNLRLGVRGHLFQERFFSCALDQRHFIAAARYVERNPVRARMVAEAWDYPWSSARYHVGLEPSDTLVGDYPWPEEIGDWRDFLRMEPEESDAIRSASRNGRPLGTPYLSQPAGL